MTEFLFRFDVLGLEPHGRHADEGGADEGIRNHRMRRAQPPPLRLHWDLELGWQKVSPFLLFVPFLIF